MNSIEEYTRMSAAKELGDKIVTAYEKFGVSIKKIDTNLLPDWIVYHFKTKGSTTEDHLYKYAKDVQSRLNIRKFQLIKYGLTPCIAVADHEIKYPHLQALLDDPMYQESLSQMQLPHVIGFDITSAPVMEDLAEYPHLLLGGMTGSGKTVGLQALVTTLAYTKSPEAVQLLVIDTGATDLMVFDGLPHLLCPIIRERAIAYQAITTVFGEMEHRIELGYTDPDAYNRLPRLVLVIDEFPSLFAGLDDEERKSLVAKISSLLQRGRHGKVYVVTAAQNPTVPTMKIDTGNFTAIVAFRCRKRNFSDTILGENGAERLAGNGDLLFKSPQHNSTVHLQGVYISPEELRQTVQQIEDRYAGQCNRKFSTGAKGFQSSVVGGNSGADALTVPVKAKPSVDDRTFAQVLLWALSQDSISVNALMDSFHLGWNKANRLVKRLEELGVVGELDAKLPRCVVPTEISDLPAEMMEFLERNGITGETVCQTLATRDTPNRLQ